MWRRPSTVSGLVVSAIVDTIERVLRAGTRSHIGNELLEALPRGAICDSGIQLAVDRGSLTAAASLHTEPNIVLRGSSVSCPAVTNVGRSVAECAHCSSVLASHAPTRPRLTRSQHIAGRGLPPTTLALAFPSHTSSLQLSCSGDHGETSVLVAGEVYEERHGFCGSLRVGSFGFVMVGHGCGVTRLLGRSSPSIGGSSGSIALGPQNPESRRVNVYSSGDCRTQKNAGGAAGARRRRG